VSLGWDRNSAAKEKDENAVRENAVRKKKYKKQNMRSTNIGFKREETALQQRIGRVTHVMLETCFDAYVCTFTYNAVHGTEESKGTN